MGFPRGTWQWQAVTQTNAVLSRADSISIKDLCGVGLLKFRVIPRGVVGPMVLSRDGLASRARFGIKLDRGRLEFSDASKMVDLRFTRRHVVAAGRAPEEEILIRFMWSETQEPVTVHIRPGQVFVSVEA